eukprot:TRINITY_DN2971_c0_g1_i1.p2 TRINITY_DN2971_c0_g1~~TRINITY_DN2971_c0_g1_i1.p2  ORF type:complete len:348 (-),score=115.76 TRINITY_DN2971_c0_g1_i1:1564-2559(-)
MNMDAISQLLGGSRKPENEEQTDTAETIHISSLALVKMLNHCRAGIPLEVMGLMLGEFVDPYTIVVADVFAMPQTGTGYSVEAHDEVFQSEMLGMLTRVGRTESVVGWYHSHPGFGCWLSSVDQMTQSSFEKLDPRAVAVVVDPIQSVRGKVVIDAFRLIPASLMLMGSSRQITSNVGLTKPAELKALIRGLGRQYYSLNIAHSKTTEDIDLLLSLDNTKRSHELVLSDYNESRRDFVNDLNELVKLSKMFEQKVKNELLTVEKDDKKKKVEEEEEDTEEEKKEKERQEKIPKIVNVGRLDPKRHAIETANHLGESSVSVMLSTMLDATVL